jgi:ATP-dependent exoDNAse (exonuclease V) beta subunit
LFDILRRFDRIYRERKQRAGTLDFADLEELRFASSIATRQPAPG